MKEGLIRQIENKNIFYDNIEKVYRYRMHCPECGKVISNCRCYQKLDVLLSDIDEGISDYTCCAKCCLIGGDWWDLGEAMQEIGLESDIKKCLMELTEAQSLEAFNDYDSQDVFNKLFEQSHPYLLSQLKNPTHEERLAIIIVMGEAREILNEYDIDYLPDIKDLTEDQAQKVLDILTDGGDFDLPSGEECAT